MGAKTAPLLHPPLAGRHLAQDGTTLPRHSDFRLTLQKCTHVELNDQRAAIQSLPGPTELVVGMRRLAGFASRDDGKQSVGRLYRPASEIPAQISTSSANPIHPIGLVELPTPKKQADFGLPVGHRIAADPMTVRDRPR
jgi:hypothetical protein